MNACYNPREPSIIGQLSKEIPLDARPTRVRSAGWAFLMALIIPGSGQIYSGKKLRGVVSLVFFLAGALGVLAFNLASPFWGVSLRCALALYVYSFLDAYFTSLELNAGKDPPPYQNPRVATALNLLTNGFGYFYLGERAKGLIVFLGMRLLGGALAQYQVVWELVSGLLAIDAYRIARRALQGGHGTPMLASSGVMQLGLSETPVRAPSSPPPEPEWRGQLPPSRLPMYVPAAMACAVGAIYAGLVVLGSVMPDYHVIDQSQTTFQQTSEERIYANPRYGVEVHIPQNWNFDIPDHTALIQASSADGICRASLLIDSISPVSGLEREKNGVISRVLSENSNLRLAGQSTASLGAHPGYEITFSLGLDDDEYLTRYVIARRGMTLYALVLTNRARFDEDCRRLTDVIRLRLVLPMDE
jgi:TM2 domain-containing membrane protein YozV